MDDQTRIQTINRSRLALRSDSNGDVLELKGEMLIGREVDCDLQIARPQVSRYHAKVYVSPNGVFLEDLKSSNGTYINGQPIHARSILSVGDHVMFDDLGFRVTSINAAISDQTQLSNSQSISPKNVDKIEQSAAQKLAPAPSTHQELERERRQSPNIGHIAPAGNDNKNNVNEIPDMEEFLRFAGSGLKPQEPMANKASPFGLGKEGKDGNERALVRDQHVPQKISEPEPVQDELKKRKKAHDISELNFPKSMPLESESGQQEQLRPPSVAQKAQQAPEEEDKTSYLSLNKMDQYGAANQRSHGQLTIGSGPRLIAITAPIRGKVFPLESGDDVKCWSVGRDDSCDICLRDKAVSREHAWITKMDAVFQLRVNETANDILVNGKSVNEVDLKHGDRLQFGTLAFDFRVDESASGAPVQPQPRTSWLSKITALFRS